jgi:hypothetical protein
MPGVAYGMKRFRRARKHQIDSVVIDIRPVVVVDDSQGGVVVM